MVDEETIEDSGLKLARIEFRLSHVEKSILWDIIKKEKISISDYLRGLILTQAKIDPDLKDKYEAALKAITRTVAQAEARQKSFYMYIDKNCLRRINEAARFSLHSTGSINMVEIRAIIKNYKTIFDELPDEIKLIKSSSFKEVERCSELNYLTNKLNLNPSRLAKIQQSRHQSIKEISLENIQQNRIQKKEDGQDPM